MLKNVAYFLALHSINGLGPIRLKAVLNFYKDPKLAWEADPKELLSLGIFQNVVHLLVETRKKLDPQKYQKEIEDRGICWMTIFDENYPKRLKEIYDPPLLFYYQGEILPSDEKAVAVVGTRKMSGYGKLVTEKLTKQLVGFGITIVSGLARGVDSQAHQTVLEENGRTLAVLGGGLKHIFPSENVGLARKIIQGHGAIISEFPPDAPSVPGNFPARNRIISGLSKAVLVTEAAEDSGSLITARLALEQGREVFAVPGPITSELSKGPSLLIKEGCRLITEAEEVVEELGWERYQPAAALSPNSRPLSKTEEQILEALISGDKHIDELCRDLNFTAALVSASLIKMEILGVVKNLGGGFYCKVC